MNLIHELIKSREALQICIQANLNHDALDDEFLHEHLPHHLMFESMEDYRQDPTYDALYQEFESLFENFFETRINAEGASKLNSLGFNSEGYTYYALWGVISNTLLLRAYLYQVSLTNYNH